MIQNSPREVVARTLSFFLSLVLADLRGRAVVILDDCIRRNASEEAGDLEQPVIKRIEKRFFSGEHGRMFTAWEIQQLRTSCRIARGKDVQERLSFLDLVRRPTLRS